MKAIRNFFAIFAAATMLLTSGVAFAAKQQKPDGTVVINETDFALIVGGSVGGGKLKFKGKTHDFTIGGVSVGGDVGMTKISATGEVYNLKDISKFAGIYSKADVAAAAGPGAGALYLKNENGVVLKLHSKAKGVQLNIGSAGSVEVKMK
jgi:hypothetical protein